MNYLHLYHQLREQCAQIIEHTRIYSSSPKKIFDISHEARQEQAKVIRALPLPDVDHQPVGWCLYADGVITQRFARTESEIKEVKAIAKLRGEGEVLTCIPVFAFPPDVEALRKDNAVYDKENADLVNELRLSAVREAALKQDAEHLRQENARLASLVAELQKDAERLNFLDNLGRAIGFENIHEGNVWEISGAYPSLRLAIDSEMRGEAG